MSRPEYLTDKASAKKYEKAYNHLTDVVLSLDKALKILSDIHPEKWEMRTNIHMMGQGLVQNRRRLLEILEDARGA